MSNPPPITLRPLTVVDAPRLALVYQAGNDYFRRIAGRTAGEGQASHDLDAASVDPQRHLLGIYLEDSLVGVMDFRLDDPGPREVRLGLILLMASHRRRGLGSWALRILEAWLDSATPCEAMVVAVTAQDIGAQAFFQYHDYRFTGQATRVPAGPVLARFLTMRKTLSP